MSILKRQRQPNGVRIGREESAEAIVEKIRDGTFDVGIWNSAPNIENCYRLIDMFGGARSSPMFPVIRDIKVDPAKHSSIAESCAAHPLHTDGTFLDIPPEYFFLQVVQGDDGGGGASIFAAIEPMLVSMPEELLSALRSAQVAFGRFDESRGVFDSSVGPVVFTRHGSGRLGFRWRCDDQVQPQIADARDTKIANAIEWIRDYFADCPLATIESLPGDHLIVANDRVVHGRTELLAGEESTRWLRRVWIA